MPLIQPIIIIIVSSAVIYFVGERFAAASSRIGDHFKLSRSVKGATFDAIASSMPELMVAMFSVIFFQSFEVGIGTIAGSALFNLLVIPGLAVLVAPVAFKVDRRVIMRDALFYVIAVFLLFIITFYFSVWGTAIALIFLAGYVYYVHVIMRHAKKDRDLVKPEEKGVNIHKEILVGVVMIILMGIVTYMLTESAIHVAEILNISPVFVAFILIAAVTSVPDTVISVVNAKKGDIDDAASNVFGSNVFDIFVGLGLPLLIFSLMSGPTLINFPYTEILFGLMGATIMVLYFFAEDHTLEMSRGVILLIAYVLFIIYVILLAFGHGVTEPKQTPLPNTDHPAQVLTLSKETVV